MATKKEEPMQTNITQCVPPHSFVRNGYGLLTHINHQFNDDGSVNWRSLIKKQYLVLNRGYLSEIEKKYEKTFAEVEQEYLNGALEVDDKYLLILLAGIKELAQLRGYTSVVYSYSSSSEDASVNCRIEWIPNYETNNLPVVFESMASASINNTFDFGQNFLLAIAENRAFVRAVRNFLRIHILGKDEVGPEKEKKTKSKSSSPHAVLEKLMESKGVDFDYIKGKMIDEGCEGAEDWESIEDIPEIKVFELVTRIKKPKKKKSEDE